MKLVHVSGIATGVVLVLGVLMILPPFVSSNETPSKIFLLSFSLNDNVSPEWCENLSSVINKHNVKAVVYLAGKTAEKVPACVTTFSENVDIGSQTYSFTSLDSINDYSQQLQEVKEGKNSIDRIGNLDSKLFKAPKGSTDENIYSILKRSGILADFSYDSQYNKYYQDQFIKFDLQTFDGTEKTIQFLNDKEFSSPVVIRFDNDTPIEEIDKIISELQSHQTLFTNPSEVTGLDLTVRNGGLFN